jgi:ArsR family metal-binding transcriptional regulator
MVSPPCLPGAEYWRAEAHIDRDISEALPYINARFSGTQYDHKAKVLVLKREGKKYAFRPRLISVAPVADREEANRLLTGILRLVNETWYIRADLDPSYEREILPTVMELYRRLPGTNCKKCGYATCMAFAADLREGKIDISCCPGISS